MRTTFLFFIGVAFCCVFTAEARNWINRKGKSVEAEFVRFDGDDKVVIRRDSNGRNYTIKISSLSDEDQEFLRILRSTDQFSSSPAPSTRTRSNEPASASSTETGPARGGPKSFDDINLILLYGGGGLLAILDIVLFIFLGKVFFGDLNGFFDCLRFWLQPDFISWFRGEAMEDFFGELKLGLYVVLCGAIVFGEFVLASKFLLGV